MNFLINRSNKYLLVKTRYIVSNITSYPFVLSIPIRESLFDHIKMSNDRSIRNVNVNELFTVTSYAENTVCLIIGL